MADNVTLPGTGSSVAADDIGGALYQRVKIALGADGAAADLAPGEALMAASVPVAIASNQSAVAVKTASAAIASGAIASGAVAAGAFALGAISVPTVIVHGQKVVTTAGTEEALGASTTLYSGVHVKAKHTNTGIVYVGANPVTNITGFILYPDEEVFVEVANLATVYIDVSVNGEGVSYIGS